MREQKIAVFGSKIRQILTCFRIALIQRKLVADVVMVINFPIDPVPGAGLQNIGFVVVRDQKGVVIIEGFIEAAVSSLAVFFKQSDNDFQGIAGGFPPFEPQPDQVHAEQAFLLLTSGFCKNSFVADDDAVFVDSHLRSPHPARLHEQHGMGFRNLGNLDVRAAHRLLRGFPPGVEQCQIRLIGAAVAVFSKNITLSVLLYNVSHMGPLLCSSVNENISTVKLA